MGTLTLAVAMGAAFLPATGSPAGAAEPPSAQPSVAEDFSYPGAGQVLSQHGLKVVGGDGHIVFVTSLSMSDGRQCAAGEIQVEKWQDVAPYGMFYCFRTIGSQGLLTLEVPGTFGIRGGTVPAQATANLPDGRETYQIEPNRYTPISPGDGDESPQAVLVELKLTGTPAEPSAGNPADRPYLAKVEVGEAGRAGSRACTGALVHPQWVVTARSCSEADGQPVKLGQPRQTTQVTVGRADLTTSAGQVSPVVRLVPHPDRDVVLARLATPVTGITPVPLASTAPAAGDVLGLAGFGRTADTWVPDTAHAGLFEVASVGAGTLEVTPSDAQQPGRCRGDAGGPALRENGGTAELVAIGHTSWLGGCVGETETRRDATETRLDDIRDWIGRWTADAGIFGITSDGRLTYTGIDSATGDRRGATVTSAAALPFTPKAMATLNYNTLLVNSTANVLYRVDVTAVDPLAFGQPVVVGPSGWGLDMLAYDGNGSLFGLAGDKLRRYTVTSAKPGPDQLINWTTVAESGFALKTLTATGPDWIMGTTAAGELVSYKITGPGGWTRHSLKPSSWNVANLLSPGNGVYYARTAAGGLFRYLDANPFDGSGADLQGFASDPVDASGWDQKLISALPFTSHPENAADVAVFGVTSDARLTYTEIDSVSGDRQGATVTSAAALPFTPKAMTTLNYDTLLVTSTGNVLYRVDILSRNPLTFATPVDLGGGWTHQLLAYDGYGSLFGIADGLLIRYTVASAKPVKGGFTARTEINTGFSLSTLAATGKGWILGTTSAGELVSYEIVGAKQYSRHSLKPSTWNFAHLLSPGNGVYYAHSAAGALFRYKDQDPFDGSGADLQGFPSDPVDASGWNQPLLSAQPFAS